MDKPVTGLFAQIVNPIFRESADRLLKQYQGRVRKWRASAEADGQPADLRDLVNHLLDEKQSRKEVLVALAAALWRLNELEDQDHAQPQ